MDKKILTLCLFFIYQLVQAQRYNYNDFMELSQTVHPLLIHLKGNVKTIDDSHKGMFHFKNQKLVSHNNETYEYDKSGYLSKITRTYNSIEFVTDSVTHKLVEIREGDFIMEILYDANSIGHFVRHKNDKNVQPSERRTSPFMEYVVNEKGQVVQMPNGGGNKEVTYDEEGNVKYIKEFSSGGICTYVTYSDKYFTKVYHGCEDIEPIMVYSDFDEYGNWQIGTGTPPLIDLSYYRFKQKFFNIFRKYLYY